MYVWITGGCGTQTHWCGHSWHGILTACTCCKRRGLSRILVVFYATKLKVGILVRGNAFLNHSLWSKPSILYFSFTAGTYWWTQHYSAGMPFGVTSHSWGFKDELEVSVEIQLGMLEEYKLSNSSVAATKSFYLMNLTLMSRIEIEVCCVTFNGNQGKFVSGKWLHSILLTHDHTHASAHAHALISVYPVLPVVRSAGNICCCCGSSLWSVIVLAALSFCRWPAGQQRQGMHPHPWSGTGRLSDSKLIVRWNSEKTLFAEWFNTGKDLISNGIAAVRGRRVGNWGRCWRQKTGATWWPGLQCMVGPGLT